MEWGTVLFFVRFSAVRARFVGVLIERFVYFGFGLLESLFETMDTFAESAHQFRYFFTSEEQQYYKYDDNQLPAADIAEKNGYEIEKIHDDNEQLEKKIFNWSVKILFISEKCLTLRCLYNLLRFIL